MKEIGHIVSFVGIFSTFNELKASVKVRNVVMSFLLEC